MYHQCYPTRTPQAPSSITQQHYKSTPFGIVQRRQEKKHASISLTARSAVKTCLNDSTPNNTVTTTVLLRVMLITLLYALSIVATTLLALQCALRMPAKTGNSPRRRFSYDPAQLHRIASLNSRQSLFFSSVLCVHEFFFSLMRFLLNRVKFDRNSDSTFEELEKKYQNNKILQYIKRQLFFLFFFIQHVIVQCYVIV